MSVENSMREKLESELSPSDLKIENVSYQHAGHAGSPGTGESHFNVSIVSDNFKGMNKIARFRRVHAILKQEMDGPVHALSLDLKTVDEA